VIRDVGTQFVIRRQEQNVTVTVVEGAIEVQRSARVASTPVWQLLTSGEQLSYGQGDVLSSVRTVSLAETTAWLDGKVIFDGRPLTEVIQEIGRYHTGEIRILDPQIGTVKVSGVFGVKDLNGFLMALERAVPVVASHVNGGLVVLEEKK
jgi:transmembrane sensor